MFGWSYAREDSDVTAARGFDIDAYRFTGSDGVFVRPTRATVTFEGAVRYCRDGTTPDAGSGVGDVYDSAANGGYEIFIDGYNNVSSFRVVSEDGAAVRMHVTYYRI